MLPSEFNSFVVGLNRTSPIFITDIDIDNDVVKIQLVGAYVPEFEPGACTLTVRMARKNTPYESFSISVKAPSLHDACKRMMPMLEAASK
jgi:hypothetical protein